MTHPLVDIEHLEKTLTSRQVYRGKIVEVLEDQSELPNGKAAHREVVRHPGGATVVPVLPDGRLLLIKQYRYPLGHALLEFPAGKLDPGETPDVSIRRELEEETGYEAETWKELTRIYTSPGFCDERISLFLATGLRLASNPRREEDEFIEVLEVSVAEVARMIRDREIIDAKTICAFALVYPEALS